MLRTEQSRILLVDPNQYMRRITRSVLAAQGYKDIVEAIDGEDALLSLRSSPPEILITELSLPLLDGFQLAKIIRHCLTTDCYLPILATTNIPTRGKVMQAQANGIDLVVAKPFSPTILRERLSYFADSRFLAKRLLITCLRS